MSGSRLILFDIDCTLVDTGGAGMAALREAAAILLAGGREVPALDLAGSTDSGIVRQLHAHFGVECDGNAEAAFYAAYLERLERNLLVPDSDGRVLPGVVDLLERLVADKRFVVGLLTGNIAAGATLKTRRFALDRFFGFGAFGDDHHDRNRLGPVALGRAEALHGRRFEPARAVVVGDTPKDVWCGRAFGARTVAVATGRFDREALAAEDPDVVLDDLSQVDDVVAHLAGDA